MSDSTQLKIEQTDASQLGSGTRTVARSIARALDALNVTHITSIGTRVASIPAVCTDPRTDEANRQLARLWSAAEFELGWDGLDAEPPSRDAIKAAEAMIIRLACTQIPVPSASVGAEGQSNLYWKADNFHADVDIYGTKASYLVSCDDQQVVGEESFEEGLFPPGLLLALMEKFSRDGK